MGWTALRDEKIHEVVGDEGWDLAADFIERLIDVYVDNFGRTPTWYEVLETIRFVYKPAVDRYNEDYPPYP